jgi:iron complex outermembrane receptor protein
MRISSCKRPEAALHGVWLGQLMSRASGLAINVAGLISLLCAAQCLAQTASLLQVAQVQELSQLSLAELTRVEVTSVSKTPQPLNSAPAAIYVITREDIIRAAAVSIPEALRLAPNLQVEQVSSSSYAITARGFGDHRAVQTQANKLLILVDGRSVYSPLFSGVFYDAIDVVMDDIDRIEVISGPGATLWGANAMNGVINIITRRAQDTQGTALRLDSGTAEQAVTGRYGGTAGDNLAYRFYAKAFDRDPLEDSGGGSAGDRWNKRQAGARVDWARDVNAITVSADAYRAKQQISSAPDFAISGANVLGRWQRTSGDSRLLVQAYYDHVVREAPPDGAPFSLDTYDLELQHSVGFAGKHELVWGAGVRQNTYNIRSKGNLQFRPADRSLGLGNLFAQDTVAIGSSLKVTAGIKLEDNPYSRWSALPDLRLAWQLNERSLLWASAARAIRAPTPFDTEVAEFFGNTLFLKGNPEFRTEKVWDYSMGYRAQPSAWMSFSASAFYDVYQDLRTIEPGENILPLLWDNKMRGSTYGIEAWATLQLTSWWRLSPTIRTLHQRLRFEESSSKLVGLQLAGDDPSHSESLRSSMDFGPRVTFDWILRHVGELPAPRQSAYTELSARLAWRLSDHLELAVSGLNLLHSRHAEYPVSDRGELIERSALAQLRLNF